MRKIPTVTLSRKVVDAIIGKNLSLEELKGRISMIGTDLEDINQNEIIVEVFPNRPDMLSEQGFGRALRSFLGIKTGLQTYDIKKSGYNIVVDSSVTMRPYTACAIIKNIELTEEYIREIIQLQEKLATTHGRNRKKSAYGVYPAQHIQFPLTYIAKEPEKVRFKPLGYEQTMSAADVLLMHPKAKEYKHLTEGWKRYPFFIDAAGNVLSMLPFTNSEDTGKIDVNTKDIFIECSGIDLQNVQIALNIIVTTLADMGGEIYSIEMKYGNKKITTPCLEPRSLKLDIPYVNKILGLSLTLTETKKALERMGYGMNSGVSGKTGDRGCVLVPSYRADILHQRDIVEDIAIAYGYENFEEKIPCIATIAQEDTFSIFKEKIAELLVGLGMLEVSNFHLIDKDVQTVQTGIPHEVLEILGPVSLEYNSLRSLILPCLLQTLRHNKQYDYPQKFFEIGTVFKKDLEKPAMSEESVHLGVVVSHQKAGFTEARQIIDYLFRMLGLGYTVVETDLGCFLSGRIGRIIIKENIKNTEQENKVAYIGEVHPQVLQNFGLEMPVVAIELNLSKVWEIVGKLYFN